MVLGCNQPDVAQLLLNHGAVIHTTDNQSTTPVSLATNHWKEKLTQFLLDKGAVRDIFIATIRDEPEEVEAMLSADSTLVNVRQKTCYPMAGATPLHIAVGKSHWDVAQILLKYGADVNALDDYGRPPMYFAAHDTVIYKMHPPQEMVQLLLEHGATLDIFSYALLGQTNQVNQLLLSAPHLANASDAGGNTPLHLAAWNGKKEMVELLIAKGALVNAQNKSGQTPIMLAGSRIRQNSGPKSCDLGYEIGEYLLFHGAICDIFTAAAIGAVEQINACLQEDAALLNATNDEGLSPLQVAACVPQAGMFGYELPANANELPSVKFLLECGAFLDIFAAALLGECKRVIALLEAEPALVNHRTADGLTPLHLAAANGQKHIVECLLEREASIDAKSARGDTPLLLAVQRGHQQIAAFLLDQGADIHAKGNINNTSLHIAALRGDIELVELLVSRGADINARNISNNTPMHNAVYYYGHTQVVKFFLDKGMDVNDRGAADYTPLQIAARQGHMNLTKFLIEQGASINVRQRIPNGDTPLHTAAWRGHKAIAELLVSHGTDVNARNDNGETPLHHAAKYGYTEVVSLLLAYGATINVKNEKGMTPLQIAMERGQKQVANLLRQYGA
jgi:cytohesin